MALYVWSWLIFLRTLTESIWTTYFPGPGFSKEVKFNPGLSQISSTVYSSIGTCNSKLQNTVEPLLRDAVMITQIVIFLDFHSTKQGLLLVDS